MNRRELASPLATLCALLSVLSVTSCKTPQLDTNRAEMTSAASSPFTLESIEDATLRRAALALSRAPWSVLNASLHGLMTLALARRHGELMAERYERHLLDQLAERDRDEIWKSAWRDRYMLSRAEALPRLDELPPQRRRVLLKERLEPLGYGDRVTTALIEVNEPTTYAHFVREHERDEVRVRAQLSQAERALRSGHRVEAAVEFGSITLFVTSATVWDEELMSRWFDLGQGLSEQEALRGALLSRYGEAEDVTSRAFDTLSSLAWGCEASLHVELDELDLCARAFEAYEATTRVERPQIDDMLAGERLEVVLGAILTGALADQDYELAGRVVNAHRAVGRYHEALYALYFSALDDGAIEQLEEIDFEELHPLSAHLLSSAYREVKSEEVKRPGKTPAWRFQGKRALLEQVELFTRLLEQIEEPGRRARRSEQLIDGLDETFDEVDACEIAIELAGALIEERAHELALRRVRECSEAVMAPALMSKGSASIRSQVERRLGEWLRRATLDTRVWEALIEPLSSHPGALTRAAKIQAEQHDVLPLDEGQWERFGESLWRDASGSKEARFEAYTLMLELGYADRSSGRLDELLEASLLTEREQKDLERAAIRWTRARLERGQALDEALKRNHPRAARATRDRFARGVIAALYKEPWLPSSVSRETLDRLLSWLEIERALSEDDVERAKLDELYAQLGACDAVSARQAPGFAHTPALAVVVLMCRDHVEIEQLERWILAPLRVEDMARRELALALVYAP